MSTTCTTCGRDVLETAKFCASCGTPRTEPAPAVTAPPTSSVGATQSTPSAPTPPPVSAPPAPAPAPATTAMHVPSSFTPPPPAPLQPAAQHFSPTGAQSTPRATGGLNAHLSSSLGPAVAMVSSAAALALGLPDLVYALSTYGSNGAKATLALLLALTIATAVVGSVYASIRLRNHPEDQVLGRIVLGVGIFSSVLATLGFLAALGR